MKPSHAGKAHLQQPCEERASSDAHICSGSRTEAPLSRHFKGQNQNERLFRFLWFWTTNPRRSVSLRHHHSRKSATETQTSCRRTIFRRWGSERDQAFSPSSRPSAHQEDGHHTHSVLRLTLRLLALTGCHTSAQQRRLRKQVRRLFASESSPAEGLMVPLLHNKHDTAAPPPDPHKLTRFV